MPNGSQRIYWDACVFLSYIDGIEDRMPTLDAILLQVERGKGKIQLVTSVLSIVEVSFGAAEQTTRRLDPDIESRIDSLWADDSVVKLVEFHRLIAKEARDLVRLGVPRGWTGLRSADAIHLATAKRANVAEFHTCSRDLVRYGQVLGIYLGEPRTIQPTLPGMER